MQKVDFRGCTPSWMLSGFEGEDGLLKIPFDDRIDLGIGLAADAEDGLQTPVNMVC